MLNQFKVPDKPFYGSLSLTVDCWRQHVLDSLAGLLSSLPNHRITSKCPKVCFLVKINVATPLIRTLWHVCTYQLTLEQRKALISASLQWLCPEAWLTGPPGPPGVNGQWQHHAMAQWTMHGRHNSQRSVWEWLCGSGLVAGWTPSLPAISSTSKPTPY